MASPALNFENADLSDRHRHAGLYFLFGDVKSKEYSSYTYIIPHFLTASTIKFFFTN